MPFALAHSEVLHEELSPGCLGHKRNNLISLVLPELSELGVLHLRVLPLCKVTLQDQTRHWLWSLGNLQNSLLFHGNPPNIPSLSSF